MKVVFDLDGTLIDSMPRLRAYAVDLLVDTYRMDAYVADSGYMTTVGRSFKEQLDILQPGNPRNKKVAWTFRQLQEEAYKYVLPTFGAVETIQFLNEKSIDTGIVSSSPTFLVKQVISRVIPEFTGIITGNDTGPKEKQLLAQEATHFVGDTPYDGVLAERNDIVFVGVEGTFPRKRFAEYHLSSFESLPLVADAVYEHAIGIAEKTPESLPPKRVGTA